MHPTTVLGTVSQSIRSPRSMRALSGDSVGSRCAHKECIVQEAVLQHHIDVILRSHVILAYSVRYLCHVRPVLSAGRDQ